jgi:RHS repeat-associated protein
MQCRPSNTEIVVIPGAALVLVFTAVLRGITLIRMLASSRLLGRLALRITEFKPLRPRLLAQLRRGQRTGLKLRLLAQCRRKVVREVQDALTHLPVFALEVPGFFREAQALVRFLLPACRQPETLTHPPRSSVVGESFTPFGARRNPNTWSGPPSTTDLNTIVGITRQGYTFQTVLGLWMNLNHMNGRVQDAITGRMLSADPHIPDKSNSQSYNRYTYVNNNPLTMVDPSGFLERADCIGVISCPGDSVFGAQASVGGATAGIGTGGFMEDVPDCCSSIGISPAMMASALASLDAATAATIASNAAAINAESSSGFSSASNGNSTPGPGGASGANGVLAFVAAATTTTISTLGAVAVGAGVLLAGALSGDTPQNNSAGVNATTSDDPLVTVTHFTDPATMYAVQQDNNTLWAGTYVTTPSQVAGLTQSQVEAVLWIEAGQGAYSTTFQTAASNLVVPQSGPLTQGGAVQFQLLTPTQAGLWTQTFGQ